MKKLVQGIIDFRKNLTPEHRSFFAKLALGQKPDALFIACSDSRVVPNLFASTNPGDLFVIRNVGNMVPPAYGKDQEASVQAAIEFAVFSLNVSDIIICGHSECGAMQAITKGGSYPNCPHLDRWLEYGKGAKALLFERFISKSLSDHNQLSQANVLLQMQHVSSYSFVQKRLEEGKLRIHGWWFDIASADVHCFEQTLDQFVLMDEKESKLIFARLEA